MEYIINGYEPAAMFGFFEDIAAIPHGSGNEKALADYIQSFAEKRGLFCIRDEADNLLIKKPAVKAAVFIDLLKGLFYLPGSVFVKECSIYGLKIPFYRLSLKLFILGYSHFTELVHTLFKMYAVFASLYHLLSYSRKHLASVAAAQVLAAKRDKPSVFLYYLDGAFLHTHQVNVPAVLKSHAADGQHLLL